MDWSLILSLALAIPLAIIGNIITPYVKDWYVKRNTKTAKKRITNLEQQLENIKEYRADTNKLVAFGIIVIMRVLIMMSLVSILYSATEFISISFVSSIVSLLFYYLTVIIATRDFGIIQKVHKFDKYNKDIFERIEKLKKDIQKKSPKQKKVG